MSTASKSSGLFLPLILVSVGFFVFATGFLPNAKPFVKSDFEVMNGKLTQDANNVGPYYRTFYFDALPGTMMYVKDLLLTGPNGSMGARFSQVMLQNAEVVVHVPKDELERVRQDPNTHAHVYGLVVNGEKIIDNGYFIANQEKGAKTGRISHFVIGGVLFLGGLLFGWAKLKAKTPSYGKRPK